MKRALLDLPQIAVAVCCGDRTPFSQSGELGLGDLGFRFWFAVQFSRGDPLEPGLARGVTRRAFRKEQVQAAFLNGAVRSTNDVHNLARKYLGATTDTVLMGEHSYDTLLLGAGDEIVPPTPRTVAFLRDAAVSTRRIASICIAAFTLAEAGMLDGRRATTHWAQAQELQQRFPKVRVEMDRIFIADGPVWTSAGMTAGIDLALGLIERDMGQDSPELSHGRWSSITDAQEVNRSIRQCWSSTRNPIAFKRRSPTQERTFASH